MFRDSPFPWFLPALGLCAIWTNGITFAIAAVALLHFAIGGKRNDR